MSSTSQLLILTTDTEETNDDLRAPMIAVNAWCDEHAEGQRFERLPDEKAGGHKVWSMAVWACCGNYFPTRDFIKAFPTFGWNSFVADVTCLVVRDATIHSGDAWIAIDGHGGALTREPDLGYGHLPPPPPPVKLFVWTDLDALEDWAPGNAFALASTREEAIDLIVADEGGNAKLRAELEASEPRVHDAPTGYALMGGS